MRKLALTLAAVSLALGTMALGANAQTQQLGAANLHAQAKNFTPVETQVACRGYGPHCGPGFTWVCGPYGHRCWCRPCR